MALFDRLVADDDTTKIVDLGHESFESFFTLAAADRLHRGSPAPVDCRRDPVHDDARPDVGRSLSQSARPIAACDAGAASQRDARLSAAPRQISDRRQRRADGADYRRWRRACAARSTSRRSHSRIRNMANATDIPLDAHIELQRWLRRIYLEFRELDLRYLLADLQILDPALGPKQAEFRVVLPANLASKKVGNPDRSGALRLARLPCACAGHEEATPCGSRCSRRPRHRPRPRPWGDDARILRGERCRP